MENPSQVQPQQLDEICSYRTCERRANSKGYCRPHWYRWSTGLDMYIPPEVNKTGRICQIEDCKRPHFAKGYCKAHYSSWRWRASREGVSVSATTKRRRDKLGIRKVGVSVDAVTDAAVTVVMEREGLTYSAALCSLTTNAALHDDDCMDAMRKVVFEHVRTILETGGWHPGLFDALSSNVKGDDE